MAFPFRALIGLWILATIGVSGTQASESARTLRDVTTSAGIQFVNNSTLAGEKMTGGAAASDFDGDGFVDLFVTRIDNTPILYRNNRDGTFSDVTAQWFSNLPTKTNGATWGDINNDGLEDLYVTSWNGNSNYLFINTGERFEEQATLRGAAVAPGTLRTGVSAAFGDYDNDGYLDIYTTEWTNFQNRDHSRLLHNRGAAQPGYFDDVTTAAGVNIKGKQLTFAPRFTDLDRDGHVDIALASDFSTSQIFWNNGNGTFTRARQDSGITADKSAMGSALGDYDNDGDLDWLLTNTDFDGNTLYKNLFEEGNPRKFQNVATAAGVVNTGWSWGSSFFELDNDGNLDLAVTNGYVQFYRDDPVYVFQNQGPGSQTRFVDVSNQVLQPRDTQMGSGLLVFDYNNDGAQDIFIVNGGIRETPVLYQNTGQTLGSFLQIDTIGTASNRDGYGTWVRVVPDSSQPTKAYVAEINSGSNFLGQNQKSAHFGLGSWQQAVDQVELTWPSGITQKLTHVPINQRITVTEMPDLSGDGTVGGADAEILFSHWQGAGEGDFNRDGRVDAADAEILFAYWNEETTAQSVPEPVSPLGLVGLLLAVHRRGLVARRRPADDQSGLPSAARA